MKFYFRCLILVLNVKNNLKITMVCSHWRWRFWLIRNCSSSSRWQNRLQGERFLSKLVIVGKTSVLCQRILKTIICRLPFNLKSFFIGSNESSHQGLFKTVLLFQNSNYFKSYHGKIKILKSTLFGKPPYYFVAMLFLVID